MSFIIKDSYTPFIITKLTEYGRKKLAKGELNFSNYAFGDSEIDYRYIDLLEPNGEQILLPKDANPTIKTYLVKTDGTKLNPLASVDKKTVKATIHNTAAVRGFFDATVIKPAYFRTAGTINSSLFNGTNQINLGVNGFENGDFILFKTYYSPVTGQADDTIAKPVQWLIYKIQSIPALTLITVDRNLPNYLNYSASNSIPFYIIPKKDNLDIYYSSNAQVLWDDEHLNFKKDCLLEDTKIWNFNIIYDETVIGTGLTQYDFTKYKSFDYIGEKQYLGYNEKCADLSVAEDCMDKLNSMTDDRYKNIGIIHYTNKNLNNTYAELFYIDHANNINFLLDLPLVMWHRRQFTGSGTGNLLGMSFISYGAEQKVANSDVPYYDLVDNPALIGGRTPKVVGRVFHTLKIATIHDSELLAALTYKSNRNYTLPALKAKMIFPINGIGNGILLAGKTCFLTYMLESDDNTQIILPQQNYVMLVNNTPIDRDIQFEIEDVGLLPYMKQKEKGGYDGYGFYAKRFKVLYQIVDNGHRPLSYMWNSVDYTSNFLTVTAGSTIDPTRLENQNNNLTGYTLTNTNTTVNFNLNFLSLADGSCPGGLYFGEESVLMGNIHTQVGVNIFKSQLNLKLDEGDFQTSENPTWDDAKNLWVSEIGVYDNDFKEVMVGKLFKPIEIENQSVNLFELTTDY